MLSYLGSGEYRERYLGVKIPPTNIQDYHLEAARKFADGLANRLAVGPTRTGRTLQTPPHTRRTLTTATAGRFTRNGLTG